ncbi:MAG: acyltransferase 3 [Solirubrobacterales bacterium]|nr:acyltransferase 3 [Solirubrobacterales bacterium]
MVPVPSGGAGVLSATVERRADEHAAAPVGKARFIAGDPIRALCCTSVLAYHTALASGIRLNGFNYGSDFSHVYGSLGIRIHALNVVVWFFFSLSAFLISRPFVAAIAEGRRLPSLGNYTRNRVLRIVPAFWAAFTLSLIVYHSHAGSIGDVLSVYGFAQVWHYSVISAYLDHGWTTNIEVLFYIGLPVAAVLLSGALRERGSRDQRLLAVAGFAVAVMAASIAITGHPALGNPLGGPAGVMWAFGPGVILACAEQRWAEELSGTERGKRIAYVLLAVGLVLLFVYSGTAPYRRRRLALLASVAVPCLIGAPLVLQWATGRCWRILDNRFLQWLGERSYGFYLFHLILVLLLYKPVMSHFSSAWAGFLVGFVVLYPLALIAGHLSFTLVERPFLRLRHGWRRRA